MNKCDRHKTALSCGLYVGTENCLMAIWFGIIQLFSLMLAEISEMPSQTSIVRENTFWKAQES